MKKALIGLLMGMALISTVSCSPKGKNMNILKKILMMMNMLFLKMF